MAGIITFRPTPEAAEALDRVREEGANVSKYINELITQTGSQSYREYIQVISCYPCRYPEIVYTPENIVYNTTPISRLSARKYREFFDVLTEQGLSYFYFKVSDQHTFGVISTCHEEASIEFGRYYTYDKKDGTYNRTSIPLPQVRYDTENHIAVVITSELSTINNNITLCSKKQQEE